jgi:hypothetical protein
MDFFEDLDKNILAGCEIIFDRTNINAVPLEIQLESNIRYSKHV